MSAIEAGAAGCNLITTKLGALDETCGGWAEHIPVTGELVETYAGALDTAINNYTHRSPRWREQAEWFNEKYSWRTRMGEWIELLENL
jgi:glycosyltransferase involved in cell wall biosynthesis